MSVLLRRNLSSNRSFFYISLGLVKLLIVAATVSAQAQNDTFIIRVAEQPNDLNKESVGDENAERNEGAEFTSGDMTTLNGGGLTGSAGGGFVFNVADLLQAPDVVVDGLNLLQRNNLVAAAANMEASLPQKRARQKLNSGLRRRSIISETSENI